jgi:hypothetical protein
MVLQLMDGRIAGPEGDAFTTGKHEQILRRAATA